MKTDIGNEIDTQRRYYAATASAYDVMHLQEKDEHYLALCAMLGLLDFLGASSVLDIGSGTGRVLRFIKKSRPDIVVRGIEPVKELRDIAYARGIVQSELTDGDALALAFEDGQFDLVCEFGVLHHIRSPNRVVQEMLRVARKAIYISDCNNFGQGSILSRFIKQCINSLSMWPLADFMKTKGRGYTMSEGDGLAYSYSVFNSYRLIRNQCKSVHLFNTSPAGMNLYRSASHVALLGIK